MDISEKLQFIGYCSIPYLKQVFAEHTREEQRAFLTQKDKGYGSYPPLFEAIRGRAEHVVTFLLEIAADLGDQEDLLSHRYHDRHGYRTGAGTAEKTCAGRTLLKVALDACLTEYPGQAKHYDADGKNSSIRILEKLIRLHPDDPQTLKFITLFKDRHLQTAVQEANLVLAERERQQEESTMTIAPDQFAENYPRDRTKEGEPSLVLFSRVQRRHVQGRVVISEGTTGRTSGSQARQLRQLPGQYQQSSKPASSAAPLQHRY